MTFVLNLFTQCQVVEFAPVIQDRSRSPPSREDVDADSVLENDDSAAADLGWTQLWEGLSDLQETDPSVPIRPGEEGRNSHTLLEALLTVLDLYAAHKHTHTARGDMMKIL